ncbi:hypothetical protein [Paenibacillus sp. CECT 9249]|uniref:hypothetical protein n=1 Tax=Paenibacillus sp. CECT 9249 TaxID=2845385 RepID=UPI001E48892B|nr:hypothetical protein [Paenibacillus sp. CECT 9249]
MWKKPRRTTRHGRTDPLTLHLPPPALSDIVAAQEIGDVHVEYRTTQIDISV